MDNIAFVFCITAIIVIGFSFVAYFVGFVVGMERAEKEWAKKVDSAVRRLDELAEKIRRA